MSDLRLDLLRLNGLGEYADKIERLEALAAYAEHGEDCERWEWDVEGARWINRDRPCTCGLIDAIDAARAADSAAVTQGKKA